MLNLVQFASSDISWSVTEPWTLQKSLSLRNGRAGFKRPAGDRRGGRVGSVYTYGTTLIGNRYRKGTTRDLLVQGETLGHTLRYHPTHAFKEVVRIVEDR